MVARLLLVIYVVIYMGDMAVLVLVDDMGDMAIAIVNVNDVGVVAIAAVVKLGEVDIIVDDVR